MSTRTRVRALGAAILTALLAVLVVLGVNIQPAQAAAEPVTIDGQTRTTNGSDIYRAANFLVRYTPAYGANTRTNQYGFEAAVVGGKVTAIEDLKGSMVIPAGGYVLSGHGTSRTWLKAMAQVGDTVTLGGTPSPSPTATTTTSPSPSPSPTTTTTAPPSGTELLPDFGIRTLRQFSIVNTNGKKLLKFPVVTANVGKGPLEVISKRSSSTSTDWVGYQRVKMTDGSWKNLPNSAAQFYWAGDGHSHWHIRDFDEYLILDPSGKKLRTGEKHGYCFEDNTAYRDWPSTGKNGASPTPVYTTANACGVNKPQATEILHALSLGWADTYPASLPDQAIDVTGLADGNYTVKITADWQGFWKESNNTNNFATAHIKITGNTVTLLQANDGL